ncbi:MAG: hypothetical protein AAGG06_11705 [Pseudomonadota bacterium]
MTDPALYFVTDVETDGPVPAANSMLSFATVIVDEAGEQRGTFEAVLKARPDRVQYPSTMDWWSTVPEAWAAATENPEPPADVMPRFADWVESFEGTRLFAARPLAFDGLWIDEYLRTFAGTRYLDGPFEGRKVFHGSGLDIESYMAGVLGRTLSPMLTEGFQTTWLGDVPHTHRAIDDARGYANLLCRLLRLARESGPQPFEVEAGGRGA